VDALAAQTGSIRRHRLMLPLVAAGILWAAFFYPFIFHAPHGQQRQSIVNSRPTYVGLALESSGIILGFLVGLGAHLRPGPVRWSLGLALGIASVVMAWGAVRHLGRQFRVMAGLYVDHQLIMTGPYGLVRHPIYSGLLGMLLCTLLLLAPWYRMILPLFLLIVGTEIRVRTEDALLESRFGEAFREYQKRVPAYVPYLR
jgi:protein-S-isoprenylcysteine O-methyltransferase Ste14